MMGLIGLPALAELPLQEDFQSWQTVSLRGHITERLLGYVDSQNNIANIGNRLAIFPNGKHESQLFTRLGLGAQITKNLSIWQGYSWIPAFVTPPARSETQIWEQLLYERRFKYFSLSNRMRLEIRRQRYIEGTPIRVWNQFKLNVPIGGTRWYLVAYDIPFANLNTVPNGPRRGFNQNWAFIGLGRKLSGNTNLEAGYLNNYIHTAPGAANRMNHVIFVSLNCVFSKPVFSRPKPSETTEDKAIQTNTGEPVSLKHKALYSEAKSSGPDADFEIAPIVK